MKKKTNSLINRIKVYIPEIVTLLVVIYGAMLCWYFFGGKYDIEKFGTSRVDAISPEWNKVWNMIPEYGDILTGEVKYYSRKTKWWTVYVVLGKSELSEQQIHEKLIVNGHYGMDSDFMSGINEDIAIEKAEIDRDAFKKVDKSVLITKTIRRNNVFIHLGWNKDGSVPVVMTIIKTR